eukprot:TRINITY_DN8369_c0_g2_i1.p1 TRINITY_DN8369_c0_g2~~TRINITY_DN8369_c0_g2_i1.p1  ORF type:complete len:718 (+),score=57.06 TRINITY_DN8369_c0_g2_i1:170-2323(+)
MQIRNIILMSSFIFGFYQAQEETCSNGEITCQEELLAQNVQGTSRHLTQWHLQKQSEGIGHSSHLKNFTILHFNDWHGMYEQTDIDFTLCTAAKRMAGECAGGASRMKAKAIQLAAAEKSDIIVIAAGDMLMGSIYDSYYMGAATAVIMNLLPVAVMSLGESDFMLGQEALISFLKAVEFPVLKPANMQIDRSSPLFPLLKDFHIMEREDGFRVGFISYILPETGLFAKVPKGVTFTPIEPIIHDLAEYLVKRNLADMIFALGHAGLEVDARIANKTEHIDMIISGHDHHFSSVFNACVKQLQGKKMSILTGKALCAFNDRSRLLVDRPQSVLPAREQNLGRLGDIVPIYHSMWGGRYFGKLIVTYDKVYRRWLGYGSVTEILGSPSSDSVVVPNPQMERLMDKLRQPLIAFSSNTVGTTNADKMPIGRLVKYNETLAGNFVCDAIMWYVNKHMPAAFQESYGRVSICMQDALSLNAPFTNPQKGINYLDIINFYPMPDFIGVVKVSGEQVYEILNHAVGTPEKFVQVGGLKFSYLYKRPEGMKVMNAVVKSADDFVPIDPCEEYNIVMNTYLLDSLKDYLNEDDQNFEVIMHHGAGIQHILYLYLVTLEEVDVDFEGRIIACEIDGQDHSMCAKPGSHDHLEVPECMTEQYTQKVWYKKVIDSWEGFPDTRPINTKLCQCSSRSSQYKNYYESAVDRAIMLREKTQYDKYVLQMKV